MTGGWRRALAEGWRQRGQHAAFRIASPRWDPDALLAGLPAERGATVTESALVAAGTGLWKARSRLDGDVRRSRQIARHLAGSEQALADLGLVIQDHTGDPYHRSQSLEVIAMVDDAAVTAETVVETILPTIYLAGRPIRVGQVVVAFPPEDGGPPADNRSVSGSTEEEPRA